MRHNYRLTYYLKVKIKRWENRNISVEKAAVIPGIRIYLKKGVKIC